MSVLDEIKLNRILLSDGAWGTFLQKKGITPGECPELWNISHRDEVKSIASSYIAAGADIIETNSFGANRIKLGMYGLAGRTAELNIAAAEISREAAGPGRFVAGSVGPTGKMLMMGDVSEDELFDCYAEQSAALEKGGADIVLIETMSAVDETAIAVKAARSATKCTVVVTMTFSKDMNGAFFTMMGVSPAEMTIAMKEAGAHIIGSNCGNGIRDMVDIVNEIRKTDRDIPVMIQANAGLPEYIDGTTIYPDSPEMMASFIPQLIQAGTNIVGGCCGTTPEHIRQIAKALGRP